MFFLLIFIIFSVVFPYQILLNLENLETLFKGLDADSRGHVTKDEAIEAFKVLKIRMSGDDARHVCQLFDLEDSSQYVLL